MLSFHTGDYKLIFHYIATTNIGGDIPIDVPTNQNIGGDTSGPGIPGGVDAYGTETVIALNGGPPAVV